LSERIGRINFEFETHVESCDYCGDPIVWHELIRYPRKDTSKHYHYAPAPNRKRFKRCYRCAAEVWKQKKRVGVDYCRGKSNGN